MRITKLPNGLTVIFDRMPADSIAIQALVAVGSNYEQPNVAGISHFLEHMLFEGTTKRTAQQLTNEIERYGGEFNAATSNEKTIYYIIMPKKHFKIALTIMADILQHPTFKPKIVEKERNVILNEMSVLNDDPKVYQWILFYKHLFKRHPARNPIYGTPTAVKAIDRSALQKFFTTYYVPNNVTLSIAGNIQNPLPAIRHAFRRWKQKPLQPHQTTSEPREMRPASHRFTMPYAHAYLVFGYKCPPRNHSDSYALDVIRAILSRGQSARLFNEIRTKRGLAYVVGAHYDANIDFGAFGVYAGTEAKHVSLVRKILLKQLKGKRFTAREVQEAKSYIEGSFILANEESKDRADMNASWWMFRKRPAHYVKRIKKVTLAQVNAAARRYFSHGYTEVLIFPKAQQQKQK